MTMSGKVVSVCAEIWDDQLVADGDGTRVKILGLDATDVNDFLSATSYAVYIARDTAHELVMHEVWTKVILPKSDLIRKKAEALAKSLRSERQAQAFVFAPSVAPRFEGSVSANSGRRAASPSQLASVSARSVRSRALSPGALPDTPNSRAVTAAVSLSALAVPQQRLSCSSNNERRAAINSDDDSGDDEDGEDAVQFGTWTGMAAEFDLVHCMDGDSAPLAAWIDKAKMRSFIDKKHPRGRQTIQELIARGVWAKVSLLKWAAACSMLQSPNDKGKCHPILRAFTKGQKGKKTQSVPLSECGAGLQHQHAYLMDRSISISAKRKRGFWRLLSNLPMAVSEAFRPRVVMSSWRLCGYYPLSTLLILDQCSLWRRNAETGLSDEEKRAVLAAMSALQLIAYRTGRVSDQDIQQALPFLERYPTNLTSDLADLSVNRDRCALCIHPLYITERARAGEAARLANADLRKPKKAKRKAAAIVPWEAWTQNSHRCTVEEIRAQLDMRGVIPGSRVSLKPALLDLWKQNSDIQDKRPPHFSAAGGAAAIFHVSRIDELRRQQAAMPLTPPRVARGGAAARPAQLHANNTPRVTIPLRLPSDFCDAEQRIALQK
jgi:hypothetical protein